MGRTVKELEKIAGEVKVAVGLINERHKGANPDEARSLLAEAGEAIKSNDGARALELARKAQLTAKPTTEYLLSRAKKIADDGSQAYEKEDYSEAIKLWEGSRQEYTRVLELARERGEVEIVEALKPSMASIEEDIRTATVNRARREMAALVAEANKTVDGAKTIFAAGDFDAARDEFQSAKETYAKAGGIAGEFGFEDKARINEATANMEVSIEACLLHKGDKLIKQASNEKGKKKEDAFSAVIKYLGSFSSNNPTYDELKTAAHKGLVEGRIDIGTSQMEDSEKLFKKGEYHEAKEKYKDAQTYFEGFRSFAAEHDLEQEKDKIDSSIDACSKNIRSCVDTMVAKRGAVAKPEVVTVADLTTGIAPGIKIRRTEPSFGFPLELGEYYDQSEYIGEGGSSWVYRARRKKDGAMVAIKITKHRGREIEKSFIDEIQIWKELDHKNIARIYNYGASPRLHIEMELLAGSIENLIPLEPRKAGHLIFKIADGLRYAHGRPRPVFHLDLKPGNIMLAADDQPKIVDWGLSKMMRVSKQSEDQARGYTTLYAAPEQINEGKVDGRTDIFQLGQVLYELVTGKPPFEADHESAIIKKIENEDPLLPSSINPQAKFIEAVIMRCLEKKKENRYQSIEELHNELANVLEIKQKDEVKKITLERLDKITLYCEILDTHIRQAYNTKDRHPRISAMNKCIDHLSSLKEIIKASETKDLIERQITMLDGCVERDIKIDHLRLDAMDTIIRKARREG